jgi:hypothetical protein
VANGSARQSEREQKKGGTTIGWENKHPMGKHVRVIDNFSCYVLRRRPDRLKLSFRAN